MVILDPAVVIHPLSGLTNPPKPRSLLKIFWTLLFCPVSSVFCKFCCLWNL
jgi:hypothetical protein